MTRRYILAAVAAVLVSLLLGTGGVLLAGGATPASARASLPDTDEDGLPDEWEQKGLTVTEGGTRYFVDLPAMGADPRHKYLFIQVDYMVGESHTHKPKRDALKTVRDAFWDAPVSNPDGTKGIRIHIDAGRDSWAAASSPRQPTGPIPIPT